MTKSEVFDKVKEIIVDQTGEDEAKVTLEANIKDDLNADSLDIFEVINELEDEFDIKIETEDGIQTVGDLVAFVEQQLAAKEG
ncbi:Acyl carrier protein [Bombilactobacillus mellifer]|uniref:Acyl carrier protein n=1 Tax=Bombilactobacillus mellifer TaxID=1218492 RepID=A0A0F4LNI3_9LACO|nr:acyl carrier protein [Bombilactobacillus mellifer]KJY60407.1 Acyl carrier protein [Bombilactobacillus mellifer]MCT6826271.1 acyl carrier protein [Bombilactobacillus mellifer]MCT6844151.1 acyl carrier protein [Bombilactobacillus mellifer]MCT6894888.1 acyl carrier protein [Bombilactobacillus mellifer]